MAFAVITSAASVMATDAVIPDGSTVMIDFLAFATAIAVSIGRMTYSLSAATAAVTCAVTTATTFCIGRGHWE
ncbi:hypothetical protein [Pseudomonas sp. 6D_7.1_Bac1]|jgi:hypothetical protein|uniref:hypothetical protein n=1 Tax=Pseudomonas sp. 6D_7.1_Bac1 TaxID=2971615 RepID=UPI0029056330|nr:hypothetical protein [Pseudomonas sp. 6D_7.1_Bac1]